MTGKENIKILPDPTTSFAERDSYGYTYDGMLPLNKVRALELYDSNHAIYLLYPDNTESMAENREEIANGKDFLFGIEIDDWINSHEYQQTAQVVNCSPTVTAEVKQDIGMDMRWP